MSPAGAAGTFFSGMSATRLSVVRTIAETLAALRERGVELPASIYTLEQLESALAPLRKGGAD